MRNIFSCVFIMLFSGTAMALSSLPTGLNASDRQSTLEILGFGSAAKLLSSPYPLGGESGVEVSISNEYIPLADVSSLGAKSKSRGDYSYLNLVVGKGLYYNVDVLIQFIPIPQDEMISGYGGQIRWGFYQAAFMPATLSFVTHMSSMNFGSLLGTETVGADLVGSVNMRDVSLFVGFGQARSVGSFIGGTGGITSSGNRESADVTSPHTMFGISIKLSKVFLALEIDRFVQSTYSGKLGMRF